MWRYCTPAWKRRPSPPRASSSSSDAPSGTHTTYFTPVTVPAPAPPPPTPVWTRRAVLRRHTSRPSGSDGVDDHRIGGGRGEPKRDPARKHEGVGALAV